MTITGLAPGGGFGGYGGGFAGGNGGGFAGGYGESTKPSGSSPFPARPSFGRWASPRIACVPEEALSQADGPPGNSRGVTLSFSPFLPLCAHYVVQPYEPLDSRVKRTRSAPRGDDDEGRPRRCSRRRRPWRCPRWRQGRRRRREEADAAGQRRFGQGHGRLL